MAEEIKTPMSDFDKVEQVKDTAEIILLQDGVNARVEAPIFEQKILDKTNDRYLGKAEKGAPNGIASLDENKKIPNENLKFGEVKEGDLNVVSGGDVFNYIEIFDSKIHFLKNAIDKEIKFGKSDNFPNNAGANLNNFIWASKKHFVDISVKKIKNIAIGVTSNAIKGDFEVLFYKVYSDNIKPILTGKKIFTNIQKTDSKYILDLSDVDTNDVLGTYVFVKSNNNVATFKFDSVGGECLRINTDDSSLVKTDYCFDFTLNVLANENENENVIKTHIASNALAEYKKSPIIDLQQYINNNRYVMLLPNTYEVSKTLTIPNGTVISGVFGKTILKAKDETVKEVISLNNPEYITLNGLIIEGITDVLPKLTTLSHYKWRDREGDKIGLNIYGGCKNVIIKDCLFKKFNKAGFRIYNSFTQKQGVKLVNVTATNNYIGFDFGVRSEYTNAVNLSANDNVIGCYVASGNNMFSVCHFDVNQCGLVVSGTLNNNDSHGSFSTTTCNHNTNFSIISTEITNGYTFSGCHVFDGDVWVDDSRGFSFIGGIISAKVTFDKGGDKKKGQNSIQSTCFIKAYGGGEIITENSGVMHILKNNFFIDGSDSGVLNN